MVPVSSQSCTDVVEHCCPQRVTVRKPACPLPGASIMVLPELELAHIQAPAPAVVCARELPGTSLFQPPLQNRPPVLDQICCVATGVDNLAGGVVHRLVLELRL